MADAELSPATFEVDGKRLEFARVQAVEGNDGVNISENSMSSHPIMLICSGTRTPYAWSLPMRPMAMMSSYAITAVTFASNARSAAFRPPSGEGSKLPRWITSIP